MPTINFSEINKHDFTLLAGQLETLKLKKSGSSLGRRYVTKKLNGKTYEGSLTSLTQALVKYKEAITFDQRKLIAGKIKTLDKKTEKQFPKGLLTKILRFFRRLLGTHLSTDKRNTLLDSIQLKKPLSQPQTPSTPKPVPEFHLPKPNPTPEKPNSNLPKKSAPLASYETAYLKKYTDLKQKLDPLKVQGDLLKVEIKNSEMPVKNLLIKKIDIGYSAALKSLQTREKLNTTLFSDRQNMDTPLASEVIKNLDKGLEQVAHIIDGFEVILNELQAQLKDSKKTEEELKTLQVAARKVLDEWMLAFLDRLDEPEIDAEFTKAQGLQVEIQNIKKLAEIETARNKKQELDDLFEATKKRFLAAE